MNQDIDVSVYVMTYYHEKYIERCINSILEQKTEYTYEIVICDDCSKDATKDIIEKYRSLYPSIIRVKYNAYNIGIPKNIYQARCMCRGKYIVNLSGDDYWINCNKLQIQIDFLENNHEYIACCNRMEIRYDDENVAYNILPKINECNKEFSLKDYEDGKTLYTHGFMMKNLFLTQKGRDYFSQASKISDKVDDAVDNVLLLLYGKVYVLDTITDVYRVPISKETSNNYNSKFTKLEKAKYSIDLVNSLFDNYGDKINFKERYINSFSVALLYMIISFDFKSYMELYKSIPKIYKKPIYKGVFIKSIPKAISFVYDRCIVKIKYMLKIRRKK